MKYILLSTLFIMAIGLNAMDVGGTISQDITWDLRNSPYRVVSFLYIAPGVTLTIEPGVQVQVVGASIGVDWYDFFWHGTINNPIEPVAKMIVVHGKIVARGTQTNPIIFDTWQSDQLFRWGGIHFTENTPKSEFEYCHINRSFLGMIDYTYPYSSGALCVMNGRIYVKYCTFETNANAIALGNLQEDTVIYGCKFTSYNLNGFHFSSYFILAGSGLVDIPKLTIARCEFSGTASDIGGEGVNLEVMFNKFVNFIDSDAKKELSRFVGSHNMYGNESYNSQTKFFCMSYSEADTVYCRRNYIYKPNLGAGYASLHSSAPGYSVISDNYGYGHVRFYNTSRSSHIYNNILETTGYYANAIEIWGGAHTVFNRPRFYNNLFRHFPPVGSDGGAVAKFNEVSPLLFNNTFINYDTILLGYETSPNFYNNILDGHNNTSSAYFIDGYPPIFMNNCVEIPVPSLYDGGGNIVANPQYADSLGGDFSLAQGSPCIDAGAYLPDLPDYDIRYHKRISSGYPGGPRAVDMGAYEYNSVYIGGISGYVFDSQSLEPVDCAKIEILGKLPEFSDSLGCFPYPSGAGTWTVQVSRWDYEDLIIPNVVVVEGEDTILNIPLQRSDVATDDESTPPVSSSLSLSNFPNPFNPTSTFSFILPQTGDTKLCIYNIKGQRVKTLCNAKLEQGHHSLVWNSCDDRGKPLASGLYFAKLEQGTQVKVHKLMLLK